MQTTESKWPEVVTRIFRNLWWAIFGTCAGELIPVTLGVSDILLIVLYSSPLGLLGYFGEAIWNRSKGDPQKRVIVKRVFLGIGVFVVLFYMIWPRIQQVYWYCYPRPVKDCGEYIAVKFTKLDLIQYNKTEPDTLILKFSIWDDGPRTGYDTVVVCGVRVYELDVSIDELPKPTGRFQIDVGRVSRYLGTDPTFPLGRRLYDTPNELEDKDRFLWTMSLDGIEYQVHYEFECE